MLTVSQEIEGVMEKIDTWMSEGLDEKRFVELFNETLPVYNRLMNECEQKELDYFIDKHENFYAFFKSMQEWVESRATD